MTARGLQVQAPLLGRLGAMVAGSRVGGDSPSEVRSPYDASLVALVDRATRADVEAAIGAASGAFAETRRLPSYRRAEILARIADGLDARREELARTIALEAAKPIRAAGVEVDRAAFTFRIAAEEAKRIYGEIVPLDWLPGTEGRSAHVRRVPLGPIAGITPFNFPLNLVAHKVAPAFAAGNPLVLRPASQTPVSGAPARRDRARRGLAGGRLLGRPVDHRRRRAARRGRPDQAAHLHRERRGRLGAQEPAPDASASRSSSAATRP